MARLLEACSVPLVITATFSGQLTLAACFAKFIDVCAYFYYYTQFSILVGSLGAVFAVVGYFISFTTLLYIIG